MIQKNHTLDLKREKPLSGGMTALTSSHLQLANRSYRTDKRTVGDHATVLENIIKCTNSQNIPKMFKK